MPETAKRLTHQSAPTVVVSRPKDPEWYDVRGTSATQPSRDGRPRSRAYSHSPIRKKQTRAANTPPIHSRTSRASTHSPVGKGRSRVAGVRSLLGLGRVPSNTSSPLSARGPKRVQTRARTSSRSDYRRGTSTPSSSYRRSMKHSSKAPEERLESVPRVNPSLLSVLSSLTRTSDRSSNSSSTITPASYIRREKEKPSSRQQRVETHIRSTMASQAPNVFDYMESKDTTDTRDDQSVISSASSQSSHYQASDSGSSVVPDTPSSQSTFPPSPTTTRNQSVADLRKKYDPQYASSVCTGRSYSNSPAPSMRSARKQPSVCDVPEDDEEGSFDPSSSGDRQRSSSRSSRRSSRSQQWQPQQDDSTSRPPTSENGHYVEPVYAQHRSFSNSSAHSDRSAYHRQMAMQHYQWPTSPPPMYPPQAMNGHISPTLDRPPAPDAPDLTRRTLIGYEQMALELSSPSSTISPLYRKFSHLNHRILLHLQDELSELEEHLRTLDEIIAQMDANSHEGCRSPASRRVESYHGTDLHLRRTHLLGNIFVKTEQYNRAMASYTAMLKDTTPATEEQISTYQKWMSEHNPIHEMEARFLHRGADLITPAILSTSKLDRSTKHAALAYLPVALMLPLLLFSIIPTLAGRLLVTALIAVGAFIVAGTTRVRTLLSVQDWAVCGAVYVLLMTAVAGCIPQH